ncbi:hypothetical protein EMPS_05966 [Entomortierella parvispora]|uniref:Uncharacterized protein n=1 Tax=Entomortierella parvispora TaxID=205924 RepID=A0A9P3HBZ9_9FUNG|nr:hypothetical protein EMPS_05966 [Entomortierella parvispora]
MLLLVPTEDSTESPSSSQQRVLVILPPRANLGADTMVVPRDRRAGGMATGQSLLDPLNPASGRRRHSTQAIMVSSSQASSSTSSTSSPFVSALHSSKKERRGSHLGLSRSTLRHSFSQPSSRIFTTYSMSSSSPSPSTMSYAQRSSSMMVDDDSEDDYLYHEAFKSSRSVQSPLLFSKNSEHEEDLRLLKSDYRQSVATGGGVMARSTGKWKSLKQIIDAPRSTTEIPSGVVYPIPTAIDKRPSIGIESEDEGNNGVEEGSEDRQQTKSSIPGTPTSEKVQASSFLSAVDRTSSLSSSSSSSPSFSLLKVQSVPSFISSPGLRSPMGDSALTSPTRGRRHVSEDRTPYLTADDISSSLNAHLTPLEIQSRLYYQRERQTWSRSQRRARSTSHRPHHHLHHHRQQRESTTGMSNSKEQSQQLQQQPWPLPNQSSLQHQLLSLALATPSRIGAVHPFDRDSATMPPPPPPLTQSRPISNTGGMTPTKGTGEGVPLPPVSAEEKRHSLPNASRMDLSGEQFPHLPKLPPSAFRTVESLRLDEEKIRKEQLEQRQRERLLQEQDEIDRFLVFPSPTL